MKRVMTILTLGVLMIVLSTSSSFAGCVSDPNQSFEIVCNDASIEAQIASWEVQVSQDVVGAYTVDTGATVTKITEGTEVYYRVSVTIPAEGKWYYIPFALDADGCKIATLSQPVSYTLRTPQPVLELR